MIILTIWAERPCQNPDGTNVDHGIGVVSRRWVIEFPRSSSVGEVDGGQLRVLMTYVQSTPSLRDTASDEAPGVLPERA